MILLTPREVRQKEVRAPEGPHATGEDRVNSVQPGTPTPADLAYPIVHLIHELRPDIPLSVIASLTVEALDLAACMHLDGQWAEARQTAWPEAIKLAHSRHTAGYADRRAAELAAVKRGAA